MPAIASSLDPLIAGAPEKAWSIKIPASDNPGLQPTTIRDVILALEYTATYPALR